MFLAQIGASDCEELAGGLLAQPVNALSSLAYVAVGCVVAVLALRDTGPRRLSLLFAVCLVAIGLGSVAFHGPQPAGSRVLHDLPIVVTLGLIVGVEVLVVRRRPRRRYELILAVAAVAGGLWLLGRTGGPVCDPDSLLQLHGLWHVVSAAAFGLWWWLAIGEPATEAQTSS